MDKELLNSLRELLKEELQPIKSQVASLVSQVGENTLILKAIEHKVNVLSAEQENLKHEVSEIMGEVKAIRKDLSQVEMVTANNWADIARLKAVK
jgi:chromosome segregation ATPase